MAMEMATTEAYTPPNFIRLEVTAMRPRCFRVVAVALLFAAPAAFGMIQIVGPDHLLARQAEAIVQGEILGSSVSAELGPITTRYELAVTEVFKGRVGPSSIRFRVVGGILPETGAGSVIFGSPEFAPGDRVLLFLGWDDRYGYRILHISQGAFWEREIAGRRYFVRGLDEPFDAVLAELASEGEPLRKTMREREGFLAWLRAGDFEPDPLAGYLSFVVYDPEAPGFEPAFTIIAPPLADRWVLDLIRWLMDKKGIPGVGGGKKASKEANKLIKLWQELTKETVGTLQVKGTSAVKTNFTTGGVGDGLNVIEGSDTHDIIGQDFSCNPFFGTLGVGGGEVATRFPPMTWKGREERRYSEAGVVLNNNIACIPRLSLLIGLLHELGHTLGIGHTCGDATTLPCAASPEYTTSVMSAVGPVLPAPALNPEDRNAALYLYDPNPLTAVPCATKAPGAAGFCAPKQCGKCGIEQGACKKTKQCIAGLTCKKDPALAARYGVPAKRKFCEE